MGTDGVIVGAAASAIDPHEIWDVGAGTGLIALMLAQRFPSSAISAIEIDHKSFDECRDNLASSPWSNRVKAYEGDIEHIAPILPAPDLIVSNPPFFSTDGATSPDNRRALARQDGSLSPSTLILLARRYLRPGGRLVFIAPYDRNESVMLDSELSRMTTVATLDISSRSDRAPFRRLWNLMLREDWKGSGVETGRLDIRTNEPGYPYSPEYQSLTRDFYL